ncbi:hypothetical protein BGW39_004826 [Mortierella sp. 14UC]|nr:hypothetical protein BGW39_004826 [Mortierella sp. 14UC]
MSGTRSLYSTAGTAKTHLQGLFLTGHVRPPHPCRQPQRQLSFLISDTPSSRPKSQIFRTQQPSSGRSLSSSSSSCQAAAYRSAIVNSSKRPRLQPSRDEYPSPHSRGMSAFTTNGYLTPLLRHRCARYSTTSGGSNTHVVANGNNGGSSDINVTGDSYPYPYSDPDFLNFEQCKNPVQLEKSVASYLKSHPEPTDQALVAMLTACADLCRSTISSSHSRKHQEPMRLLKDKMKPGHNKSTTTTPITTTTMPPNLLETILQSSVFTSDQVFNIARSIHNTLSTRPHPVSGIIHDLPSRQRISSLQVINAYLNVCAITGHFDDARAILQGMLDSPQGDVKPDLTTYRHVLRAAVNMSQDNQDQMRKASIDTSVQEVIEQAAEALSKKARMAFWIKLGLGGLTGATVGKFTMMAIMALPISRPLEAGSGGVQSGSSAESVSTTHMIDALQPTEGIMEFLATQEIATGIGFAVGMLTAGYFILGSTRRPLSAAVVNHRAPVAVKTTTTATQAPEPVVDATVEEEESGSRTRHTQQHHHQHQLPDTFPRARLLGLYFPDLATTSKDEIRDYLRRSMQP